MNVCLRLDHPCDLNMLCPDIQKCVTICVALYATLQVAAHKANA